MTSPRVLQGWPGPPSTSFWFCLGPPCLPVPSTLLQSPPQSFPPPLPQGALEAPGVVGAPLPRPCPALCAPAAPCSTWQPLYPFRLPGSLILMSGSLGSYLLASFPASPCSGLHLHSAPACPPHVPPTRWLPIPLASSHSGCLCPVAGLLVPAYLGAWCTVGVITAQAGSLHGVTLGCWWLRWPHVYLTHVFKAKPGLSAYRAWVSGMETRPGGNFLVGWLLPNPHSCHAFCWLSRWPPPTPPLGWWCLHQTGFVSSIPWVAGTAEASRWGPVSGHVTVLSVSAAPYLPGCRFPHQESRIHVPALGFSPARVRSISFADLHGL